MRAASAYNNFEIVQRLLDNGANINAQDGRFGSALYAASDHGHIEVVRLLLENEADVNARSERFGTALQAAADHGHIEVVWLLLDNGADVNAQSERFGTALHAALFRHHFGIVRLLLDNGADVNIQGGIAESPLEIAAEECSSMTFQLMLNKGADVNYQVLEAVVRRGTREMVQMLYDSGTSLNRPDREGRQMVHLASQVSNIGVIERLSNLGLDVKATDTQGRNCLHYAAMYAGVDTVNWLLQQGFDPNSGDRDGWTAPHWAAKYNIEPRSRLQRTIDMLEAAGATFDREFIRNWTPYEVAIFHGNGIAWTSSSSGYYQNINPGKISFKVCGYCKMRITGPIYQCQVCVDINYCFKCKHSSDLTHPGCNFLELEEED